jgi:hypothetical protein
MVPDHWQVAAPEITNIVGIFSMLGYFWQLEQIDKQFLENSHYNARYKSTGGIHYGLTANKGHW